MPELEEWKCEECDGTGMLIYDCEGCNGCGWIEDEDDGGTMTCPDCGGESCPHCKGTGESPL